MNQSFQVQGMSCGHCVSAVTALVASSLPSASKTPVLPVRSANMTVVLLAVIDRRVSVLSGALLREFPLHFAGLFFMPALSAVRHRHLR